MERLNKPPHDIFEQLTKAWNNWRATNNENIPFRSAVRPQDISKILPHIMLLENTGNGVAQYSIVGEQVKELYARDMSNQSSKTIQPTVNAQLQLHKYLVNAINNTPCGLYIDRSLSDQMSIRWTFRTLTLPLTSPDGLRNYMILGTSLIPPEDANNQIWELATSFDVEQTTIKSIKRIDLGYGVFDLPSELINNIEDQGIMHLST